jgi:hypothetical protein
MRERSIAGKVISKTERERSMQRLTFFLNNRLNDMVDVVVDVLIDDSTFVDNGSLLRSMALGTK